jgi:hypothetical protein
MTERSKNAVMVHIGHLQDFNEVICIHTW